MRAVRTGKCSPTLPEIHHLGVALAAGVCRGPCCSSSLCVAWVTRCRPLPQDSLRARGTWEFSWEEGQKRRCKLPKTHIAPSASSEAGRRWDPRCICGPQSRRMGHISPGSVGEKEGNGTFSQRQASMGSHPSSNMGCPHLICEMGVMKPLASCVGHEGLACG